MTLRVGREPCELFHSQGWEMKMNIKGRSDGYKGKSVTVGQGDLKTVPKKRELEWRVAYRGSSQHEDSCLKHSTLGEERFQPRPGRSHERDNDSRGQTRTSPRASVSRGGLAVVSLQKGRTNSATSSKKLSSHAKGVEADSKENPRQGFFYGQMSDKEFKGKRRHFQEKRGGRGSRGF